MPKRLEQLNSLIKQEVSDILMTMIDRDHFKLLTVKRVITAKDLSSAKVYVSVPNNEFKSFREWAKSRMYDIQGKLNDRLYLKRVPRIVFVQDTTGDYVQRVEDILKGIREKEKKVKTGE